MEYINTYHSGPQDLFVMSYKRAHIFNEPLFCKGNFPREQVTVRFSTNRNLFV